MSALSAREMQVLERASHGMSNPRIGRDLELSEDTIKTHMRHVLRKLNATDRAHAVRRGFELGLLRGPLPGCRVRVGDLAFNDRVELMRVLDPGLSSTGLERPEYRQRVAQAREMADRVLAAGYRAGVRS